MGYRLKVVAGPGLGSECELEDAEVTIGRAPENGLVINDNNVSRVHAKVTVAPGNRVVVADAGSRNGVYVNDRKVNQQPINPGDRVVIGQTVIELISDAGARPAGKVPGGARPAPGTSGRRPSPNGNGGGNGATSEVRSGGSAKVVPVKGNMARTGTAKPARAGANAAPTSKGGTNPLAVIAVLVAVVLGGAMAYSQFTDNGSSGSTGDGSQVPIPTHTQPLPPGMTSSEVETPSNQIEKLPKDAKQWIDIGDSARDSGNLMQARTSFRNALKIVPNCESCKVRLDAVTAMIEEKITDREKSGGLAYEQGDFRRAADQWKIAISYIDDPNSSRAKTLKQKVDEALRNVATQPPQ